MSDSNRDKADESAPKNPAQSQDSLVELRDLLLGPMQAQLDKLQRRLDSPQLLAEDVSRILPEAISLRSSRDKKIQITLEPITEKAIQSSIKKDRKVLVEALFPVMGPAIRKAIASAIQGMVQGFNQILEHSLSKQGIKWRWEAARTQKTFAEVVLLHTLVYQVEQVFLIHKDTGLVLQHVEAKTAVSQDPDLVSGMLTAIKDFVQDSFGGQKDEALDTIRVGDRSVWIEHGSHAILAGVIRGNPPIDLHVTLRDALAEIHFKQSEEMEKFEGDATPFEEIRYILDDCLKAQFKQERKRKSYLLWIILVAVAVLLGFWSVGAYRNHRRWSNYVSELHEQPGIVITSVEKKAAKYQIYGLRDPLAPDPANFLKQSGFRSDRVIFHWEPYHSQHPKYALQRLVNILEPPETIRLELKNGVLQAAGSALNQWLADARRQANAFPWIEKYNDGDVFNIDTRLKPPQTVTFEIKGRKLYARGTASHQWINEARNTIKAAPGILNFNDKDLTDVDLERLYRLKKELERQSIFFKAGQKNRVEGQEDAIEKLVKQLKGFDSLALAVNKKYHIEIIGHTDGTGKDGQNLQISEGRAETLRSILTARGLPAKNFTIKGVGSTKPLRKEINEENRSFNRRVIFKATLSEK